MLVGAGSETTTNLLSGLFLTLAQRPDVYARLREHPELIPSAIEEQLRYSLTGSRVLPNRHPRLPHRYRHDPGRGARAVAVRCGEPRSAALRRTRTPSTWNWAPNDQIAFGGGAHFCLGTHLTRLEAGRVLTQLLPRVEAFHLDGEYRDLTRSRLPSRGTTTRQVPSMESPRLHPSPTSPGADCRWATRPAGAECVGALEHGVRCAGGARHRHRVRPGRGDVPGCHRHRRGVASGDRLGSSRAVERRTFDAAYSGRDARRAGALGDERAGEA